MRAKLHQQNHWFFSRFYVIHLWTSRQPTVVENSSFANLGIGIFFRWNMIHFNWNNDYVCDNWWKGCAESMGIGSRMRMRSSDDGSYVDKFYKFYRLLPRVKLCELWWTYEKFLMGEDRKITEFAIRSARQFYPTDQYEISRATRHWLVTSKRLELLAGWHFNKTVTIIKPS